MTRAKLINAAVFLAVIAGMYIGCATAAAVTEYPVPVAGAVILPIGWVIFVAADGAIATIAAVRAAAARSQRRRRTHTADDGYQIGLSLAAAARRADA